MTFQSDLHFVTLFRNTQVTATSLNMQLLLKCQGLFLSDETSALTQSPCPQ